MAKVKDKQRILKTAREKHRYLQGNPPKAINGLLYRNNAGQKKLVKYIQSFEREKPAN